MSEDFQGAIAALAQEFGVSADRAKSDEHARWELYRTALSAETCASLVVAALRDEPNSPLASAAVVWALEHRRPTERDRWLQVLPAGASSQYARRRAVELGVVDRLRNDPSFRVSESDVDGWTQWLQLRVAEGSDRKAVLNLLETAAAIKRIRRLAHQRVRGL